MLDILKKKDLVNTLVIVTRYFGGILLGTGGLVRAYSDSCAKLKYICEKENIFIEKEDYSENINVKLYTSKEKIEIIKSQIKDIIVKEGSKNILI